MRKFESNAEYCIFHILIDTGSYPLHLRNHSKKKKSIDLKEIFTKTAPTSTAHWDNPLKFLILQYSTVVWHAFFCCLEHTNLVVISLSLHLLVHAVSYTHTRTLNRFGAYTAHIEFSSYIDCSVELIACEMNMEHSNTTHNFASRNWISLVVECCLAPGILIIKTTCGCV